MTTSFFSLKETNCVNLKRRHCLVFSNTNLRLNTYHPTDQAVSACHSGNLVDIPFHINFFMSLKKQIPILPPKRQPANTFLCALHTTKKRRELSCSTSSSSYAHTIPLLQPICPASETKKPNKDFSKTITPHLLSSPQR